jgi:basic membrane lipoprotein Med (substrate-binding protein (PBP1-ABC) superfamily)
MKKLSFVNLGVVVLFLMAGLMVQPVEPAFSAETEESVYYLPFSSVGPVSDEGWTWSHDQGRIAVEEAFPGKVKTIMVENVPYSVEAARTFQQFCTDGAKLCYITSEMSDFLGDVAEKNPKVMFLECNGHRTPTDNIITYYIAHWDPSYLIGMAAGLLTKTNKLGYVGSFAVQAVYASVNAFQMGAASVNPKVKTQVVLINSWFDPSKAKQAAESLIDSGVDFLFGIMDEAAYLQVAEGRGVWAAMWNTDIRRFGPNAYVSSIMLDWNDFYVSEAKAILEGTWKGHRDVILPISQGVDRDVWGQNVPGEISRKVEKVRDKMIRDGYNPFVGPIYDTKGKLRVPAREELTPQYLQHKWNWPVKGTSGLPYN